MEHIPHLTNMGVAQLGNHASSDCDSSQYDDITNEILCSTTQLRFTCACKHWSRDKKITERSSTRKLHRWPLAWPQTLIYNLNGCTHLELKGLSARPAPANHLHSCAVIHSCEPHQEESSKQLELLLGFLSSISHPGRIRQGLMADTASLQQTCTEEGKGEDGITTIKRVVNWRNLGPSPVTLCWLYFSLIAGRLLPAPTLQRRCNAFTQSHNSDGVYCV